MDKIKEIGIKPLALAMAVLALLAGVLGVAGIGVGAIICGVLAAVVAVLVLLVFGDGNMGSAGKSDKYKKDVTSGIPDHKLSCDYLRQSLLLPSRISFVHPVTIDLSSKDFEERRQTILSCNIPHPISTLQLPNDHYESD